jgi:hypothetical protein
MSHQKSSYGGAYTRGGEHGVLGSTCVRREKRDKCEERGRALSGSTNHHGLSLDKCKSIYTNDEAIGLAG